MNDYCLNQRQGLNARQHTSTYNEHPMSITIHHFPPPPTPQRIHLLLDVFLINQKHNET